MGGDFNLSDPFGPCPEHRHGFTSTDTDTNSVSSDNNEPAETDTELLEMTVGQGANEALGLNSRRRSSGVLPDANKKMYHENANGEFKRPLGRRILSILWDTFDKDPEERALLHKTDIWILTYVSVAYFIKYLDQTNVNNAYVSGMKEDLSMNGNEFNILLALFTAGYCLGNIPSQLLMTRIRPSIWLPSLELIWGLLVMCMAATHSLHVLYILRFFVGLLEASAYPGILTLLGNWYTPSELGKRAAIFFTSACFSQMFSGYLQASLYLGMDGKLGLRAWQWLFIFDGILTVPVAMFGYIALPDSPANSRARWLTAADRQLALKRMAVVGREPPGRLTMETFRSVFTDWPVYAFSIVFIGQLLGNRVYVYFGLYLKSTGRYTVAETNVIPSAGYGFQAVTALILAWISDLTGERELLIAASGFISLIGTIILCIWPEENINAMLAGWILTFGQGGASALIMSYINELLSFSAEQRLMVIGVVETAGFVMNSWVILLVYPVQHAPMFPIGYQMATGFFAVELIGILIVRELVKRWPPNRRYQETILQKRLSRRDGEV